MPVDYTIQTTRDTGTGIPMIEDSVQFLLNSGCKFQCVFNRKADSFTIYFLEPLTDFRIRAMLRTKGWDVTPETMTLRFLQRYRPRYQSPDYPTVEGKRDLLVNTGPEMAPDPIMATSLSDTSDQP